MGLFDFVKKAGAKIFGTQEAHAEPQAQAVPQPHPEKAAALVKFTHDLGLQVTDLVVVVVGEVATVSGKVADQATKEKVVLAIGNVEGIAQVDDRLVVETPEPPAVFYTVVSGDSLSKIAKHHYGNANKYMAIFEANKPMLKDPDKIYPGQVLRIPPLA
jgi:nucleoid-associated protein YgaU